MTEKELKAMRVETEQKPFEYEDYEETDEYGIYKTGVYSMKNAKVLITRVEGMWRMAILCKYPLGLVQLRAFKNTFIPNKVVMGYMFGERETKQRDNVYHLYELRNG